jgi:hypothetical protein
MWIGRVVDGLRRSRGARVMRQRSDAGVLAKPIKVWNGSQYEMRFEARIARTHDALSPLQYPTGPEYRRLDELASIVRQLPGALVYRDHPSSMPAKDSGETAVGRIESARLDGDHAVATITMYEPEARAVLASGAKEISLGYSTDTVGGWQTNIRVDHVAIVMVGRCGSSCALRADSKQKGVSHMCGCDSKSDATQPTDVEADAKKRMRSRLNSASKSDGTPEGGSFFGVENGSGVASIGNEEEKIAGGARDMPAELLARLKANARLMAAHVPDEVTRNAMIAEHVANGLAKLAGGR